MSKKKKRRKNLSQIILKCVVICFVTDVNDGRPASLWKDNLGREAVQGST